MSKIDNVTKELGQTDRPLRDDELESVIGGFIVNWRPVPLYSALPHWALWVCCRTIVLRRAFSHVFRRGPSRPAQVSGLASFAPPDRTTVLGMAPDARHREPARGDQRLVRRIARRLTVRPSDSTRVLSGTPHGGGKPA